MKRTFLLTLALIALIAGTSSAQSQIKPKVQIMVDNSGSMLWTLETLVERKVLFTTLNLNSIYPRTDCVFVNISILDTQSDQPPVPFASGFAGLDKGANNIGIYLPPIGKNNTLSGPKSAQQLFEEGLIIVNRSVQQLEVALDDVKPVVEKLLGGRLQMELTIHKNAKTLLKQVVPIRVESVGSYSEQVEHLLDMLEEAGAVQPELTPNDSTKPERPLIPADRRTVPIEELGRDTATIPPVKPELCGHKVREFVRREVGEWTRKDRVDSDMSLDKPLRPAAKSDITWTREIRTVYSARTCVLPRGHAGAHKYGPAVEETDVKVVEETLTYWEGQDQVPPKDHWTDRLPR